VQQERRSRKRGEITREGKQQEKREEKCSKIMTIQEARYFKKTNQHDEE
jgi:hypothetical protein